MMNRLAGRMARAPRAAKIGRPRGFTLVELMVAVAVVAILAAIAIPSYSAYVVRGKRAQAKAALLQAAQFLERNYSSAGCYDFSDAPSCLARKPVGAGTAVAPSNTTSDYAMAFGALPAGTLPGQGFTLTATPCGAFAGGCAGGSTFTDAECGTFTLDNTGAKGALAGAAAAAVAQQCWGR